MTIKEHISEVRLSQLISREFLKTSNQFYLYSDYCNAYYKSIALLQTLYRERPGLEEYISFLARDPRAKGLEWNRKGKKEMRFLLLSDIIVIAQLSHSLFSSKNVYRYLTQLSVSEIRVRELDEASFEIFSASSSFSVYCNGVEEKEAFLDKLTCVAGRSSFLPHR